MQLFLDEEDGREDVRAGAIQRESIDNRHLGPDDDEEDTQSEDSADEDIDDEGGTLVRGMVSAPLNCAGPRKFVSAQQHLQYRLARRQGEELHPIYSLRKLGQQLICDEQSRIEEQRHFHVRKHYTEVYKTRR